MSTKQRREWYPDCLATRIAVLGCRSGASCKADAVLGLGGGGAAPHWVFGVALIAKTKGKYLLREMCIHKYRPIFHVNTGLNYVYKPLRTHYKALGAGAFPVLMETLWTISRLLRLRNSSRVSHN